MTTIRVTSGSRLKFRKGTILTNSAHSKLSSTWYDIQSKEELWNVATTKRYAQVVLVKGVNLNVENISCDPPMGLKPMHCV